MSLRDALLRSLVGLPGKRVFHLHVLVTSPRKHAGLFPYARPRPRAYLQDILILLSEQPPDDDERRVFVGAIEAGAYTLPATDSAILYIAKVDSTGQGSAPSPTAALVQGLLAYYADPNTRPLHARHLWIHVFARAQSQYLFPNSADFPAKRMLSDIRLCAWWKRLLEQTAVSVQISPRELSPSLYLSYLLPGMNELEAARAIRLAAQSTTKTSVLSSTSQPPVWEYGHPFSSSSGIPLPCQPPLEGQLSLGHYIPYFEDDPKSRFLDEIACATDVPGVWTPPPKRRKIAKGDHAPDEPEVSASKEEGGSTRPSGELGRVSAAEFWERISFRQECVAGAVTGFFALAVSAPTSTKTPASSAPRAGEVSVHVYRRVHAALTTANEFSTTDRARRATATIEGAIRGLCEGMSEAAPAPAVPTPSTSKDGDPERPTTPKPNAAAALLAPPQTPPRTPTARALAEDASPNPFSEAALTHESYSAFIHGSVCVDNPPLPTRGVITEETAVTSRVTILTARKKNKRKDA